MQAIGNYFQTFIDDEDGSQIIEYALIVAVVSLTLILLLSDQTNGIDFSGFVTKVNLCLSSGKC